MAHKPKTPLRRSFSEHVKDSTNKAWEMFWRSAREKRLSEIEAKEACDWLRAAGFPQYEQLFKNCHIPIDIDWVKSDHEFLDSDTLESLCRRLTTLNKCVEMKLDLSRYKRRSEVDDDVESCAISPKWSYNRKSRRWIHTDGMDFLASVDCPISSFRRSESCEASLSDSSDHQEILSMHSSSSTDSDGGGPALKSSEEPETSRSSSRCSFTSKNLSPVSSFSGPPSPVVPRDISCEKRFPEKPPLKKGQSLLRKMDKLRLRGSTLRSRGQGKNQRLVIGSPVLQEAYVENKHEELHYLNLSGLPGMTSSPVSCAPPYGSSSSPSENSSAVSTPSPITKVRSNCKRQNIPSQQLRNQHSLNGEPVFKIPHGHKPGTFPTILHNTVPSPLEDTSVNWRTGSFHGYHRRRCRSSTSKDQQPPCSPLVAHDYRVSIYDNVPDHLQVTDDDVFSALDSVMERIAGLQKLVTSWTDKMPDDGDSDFSHSSSPSPSSLTDIHLEIKEQKKKEQNGSMLNCNQILQEQSNPTQIPGARKRHWCSEQILPMLGSSTQAIEFQLAPCVSMLQRLSLLRLTALMDKHSPFSKQGWNWTVPKVYRNMRGSEPKNRKVFGVPLLLNVQWSGKPLPPSILRAMEYLKTECMDQVGVFRKSGVKSRIQNLRDMIEADPDGFSFEDQSAFDVADMIKQYFRDLPEPVFSSKLCESFLHIYQYFPKDQQFAAVQAAIFLMPDENREALQCLLFFLNEVVACVEENHMTPTNIAVCLAPSLFHLNVLQRDSNRRGQRKYSLGRPDQRDLSENLAATQGLAHMVTECSRLFQMPRYWKHGAFKDQTMNIVVGINTVETDVEDRAALDVLVQQLLMEAREKTKSWVTFPNADHVDVAFKKMDDGYPIRLWRGSVEVDAQQKDVFQRVLREHSQWESELQHSEVQTLDRDLEIYQYSLQAAGTRPPLHHLLLRTWHSDPSSGPLFVAAASVKRADVANGGVTARVLCCMFLVEATSTKKSRLTHFCRTDIRGRSVEWHNKVGGHLLSHSLVAIKDSFKPKTKEKL